MAAQDGGLRWPRYGAAMAALAAMAATAETAAMAAMAAAMAARIGWRQWLRLAAPAEMAAVAAMAALAADDGCAGADGRASGDVMRRMGACADAAGSDEMAEMVMKEGGAEAKAAAQGRVPTQREEGGQRWWRRMQGRWRRWLSWPSWLRRAGREEELKRRDVTAGMEAPQTRMATRRSRPRRGRAMDESLLNDVVCR